MASVPPLPPHLAHRYGASDNNNNNHLHPVYPDTYDGASAHLPLDLTAASAQPIEPSPLAQSVTENRGRFNEEWESSRHSSSIGRTAMQRSSSVASHTSHTAMSQENTLIPSRGGTLKKRNSLRRTGSMKRSLSRRSSRAGGVRSLALQSREDDEMRSAFFCPVPTSGSPTDVLAARFNAWRKVLKDLISYFREIQSQYDARAKSMLKIANVANNISMPPLFLPSGGIDDALQMLRDYHKRAIMEANKSKEIENDVILALTGLRSDLQQKIKEIKTLSGDFKNSVDKEMEATTKAVNHLQEALGRSDIDPSTMTGKQDPYLLRLAVDRQVERQIDEESYLHQAYLNLEASGRELEAIVVGEIQKSYNAYAGILRREAEESMNTIESLRNGPISMSKDHEWAAFIEKDNNFVDPRIPIRSPENIVYPGYNSEMAAEIRAGLLERKSKYLKSYTPGWYVLSPTHLHEFKSADKTQAPVMSLYLGDQKLGSHSAEGSSSNKFMLKGRQTGAMHRGHSWVFRAESYDTMMAWYDEIKLLTEKSPQERNAYVRQHARSLSGALHRSNSVSSDGVIDDEDEEPFSTDASAVVTQGQRQERRPQAGGRFPSDIQVNAQRGLQAPLSPSSGSSNVGDVQDRDVVAAAALPGSRMEEFGDAPQGDLAPAADTAERPRPFSFTPEQSDYYTHHPVYAAQESPERQPYAGAASTTTPYAHDVPMNQHEIQTEETVNRAPVIAPIFVGRASHDNASSSSPYASGGRSVGETPASIAPSSPGTELSNSPPGGDKFGAVGLDRNHTPSRPALGEQKTSLQSIQGLHIPGEYPRSSTRIEAPSMGVPV